MKDGLLAINEGRDTVSLIVTNKGDRPVQVGSHYHFYEVNRALQFNRPAAFGMRLCIPAGTAVRFEPGEEKPVLLTRLGGSCEVYGLNGLTQGSVVQQTDNPSSLMERLARWEGASKDDIHD